MPNQENNTYQFFDKNTSLNDDVFNISPAHRVKQIHGNEVIEVCAAQQAWIDADAIITHTPNLPIGVITADCAPVLLHGDGVIGAAHAGWQGAVNGVLDNTIKMMGSAPSSIHALIGPCIQQSSYEVSIGFEKPFLEQHPEAEQFFIKGTAGKLQFDLSGYCAFRLKLCGVESIDISDIDTLTHRDFHSHRGGATSSDRNLSAIMLSQ